MSTDLTTKGSVTHPYARWQMLPLEASSFTAGFWSRRQKLNRETTLLHGYQMLEEAGNFHNLRVAAGLIEGEYRGREFIDSDVYKWLEAASYDLHINPDNPPLQQQVDQAIDLVAAAQQADGYINCLFVKVLNDTFSGAGRIERMIRYATGAVESCAAERLSQG